MVEVALEVVEIILVVVEIASEVAEVAKVAPEIQVECGATGPETRGEEQPQRGSCAPRRGGEAKVCHLPCSRSFWVTGGKRRPGQDNDRSSFGGGGRRSRALCSQV